jgi:hypothetical protein
MALKFSTGLRQYLLEEGPFRKAFEDAVLNIYSGTAPSTVDEAPTGVLLVKITKASGAVTALTRSTPKRQKITIGTHAPDTTFKVNVTVDGAGPTTYTYTNTPDAGDADAVAKKVAQMLSDIPQLRAIASGASGELFVQSAIDGLDFTLADGGGTGTLTVAAAVEAAVALNTLKLGAPVAGVISKNGDSWTGLGLVTGVAGYGRFVTTVDTGGASATEIRLQGNVSTSGAEFNITNMNITAGATQTVDSFAITQPGS